MAGYWQMTEFCAPSLVGWKERKSTLPFPAMAAIWDTGHCQTAQSIMIGNGDTDHVKV